MGSLLESRLGLLRGADKRPSQTYEFPALDHPTVLYPGAGADRSVLDRLKGKADIIYQDILYGTDANLLAADYGYLKVPRSFIYDLRRENVTVIDRELEPGMVSADLVVLSSVFGFLFQNDFSDRILANSHTGTYYTGYGPDLNAMVLLYDGLEWEDDFLKLDVPSPSPLYPYLTSFPELSYWVLKGKIKTFTDWGEKKFRKLGKDIVAREIAGKDLRSYYAALPPELYPDYLRDFLSV